MSYELTKKMRELTPYTPIEGEYPVRLDANESCIDLNGKEPVEDAELEERRGALRERVLRALGEVALNRYPDPYCKNLCKAFASRYGVSPDWVTAGNGSDELISILVSCLTAGGEKVLSLTPDFSMYSFYAEIYERAALSYQKDGAFSADVDEVIRLSKENEVKALLFSNPCNPTGAVMTAAQVEALCKALPQCLVVADEAYMEFCEEKERCTALPLVGRYDNLVVLKTCSKAVGLAGLRLGFSVAGGKITRALRAAKSPYNVNALSQAAGEIVLSDGEYLDRCVGYLTAGRKALEAGILELAARYPAIEKVNPTAANFIFVKVREAEKVWDALIAKGVAVRRMGEYLRVCTGNQGENQLFLETLKEILEAEDVSG